MGNEISLPFVLLSANNTPNNNYSLVEERKEQGKKKGPKAFLKICMFIFLQHR
jgi:hypothetical protein